MPAKSTPDLNTNSDKGNTSRRAKYLSNVIEERSKARERARRRAAVSVPKESVKIRHREAQARYREKNRMKLRVASWQYRMSKKRETELSRDEIEFQQFMALELDAEERQRIDALLA